MDSTPDAAEDVATQASSGSKDPTGALRRRRASRFRKIFTRNTRIVCDGRRCGRWVLSRRRVCERRRTSTACSVSFHSVRTPSARPRPHSGQQQACKASIIIVLNSYSRRGPKTGHAQHVAEHYTLRNFVVLTRLEGQGGGLSTEGDERASEMRVLLGIFSRCSLRTTMACYFLALFSRSTPQSGGIGERCRNCQLPGDHVTGRH